MSYFIFQYIKNNAVQDVFLFIVPLDSESADGYLEMVKNELNNLGIS